MDPPKPAMSVDAPSYTCTYCNRVLASKRSYRSHINRHPEACPYRCQDCTKSFHLENGLRVHRARCHPEKATTKKPNLTELNSSLKMSKKFEKTFCCQVCRTVFSTTEKLKEHSLTHPKNPKNYSCNICKKNFSSKAHRTEHALTHKLTTPDPDKENPFPRIDDVQKTSLRGPKLGVRANNHDKVWKCEICGRGFVLITKLKNHESTHGKMALFDCDLCDKVFADLDELSRHRNLHNSETFWECRICNKQLCSKANLARHNQMMHLKINVQRKFACRKCKRAFKMEAERKQHEARCHSENEVTIFVEE